jgi:hypothetical protein
MKHSHVRFTFIMQQHMNALFVDVFKQIDDMLKEYPMLRGMIDKMISIKQ